MITTRGIAYVVFVTVATTICGCQKARPVAHKQAPNHTVPSNAPIPAVSDPAPVAAKAPSENTTMKQPAGWCTRCRGDGVIHCRECDDGLRLVCKNCGGTGKVKQIFGSGAAMRAHEMPCTSCYGVDRRVWCGACKGNCGTCGACNGIEMSY